ncbi:MAG TPA: class I SAM-dependent methyltransferase [Candidatus Limnocylindrales bacterium]|jgi:ubiquinone/menaquinone biosynthesis C-methylase UbiE|nr:class I SAM-dependent methyltransferase [Candidatus Limnocylindrales bacterium]
MSTSTFWRSGSGYEAYVGRWSRRVADVFIDRLDVRPVSRWVDVGCGTGAVTQTVLTRCEPASILGVDPSETFLEVARSSTDDRRASFDVADGASIPLADDTVDAAVSGLVLNFVPDPVAMLAEMRRVTRPGGTVAIYVWDYGDGMQIMRHFWDAAIEQDPRVAATAESLRFEICKPEPLRAAFQDAGLADIEVEPIDVPTVFRDFDDYWQPFLMSTAPAPRHAMSLSDTDRANLRERIRARLPIADDGSIPLTARAWAVRATD